MRLLCGRPPMEDDEKPLDSWVIDVYQLKKKPSYFSGRSCTILKVPRNLHQVQQSAFDPKIISIGPLHYGGSEGLELMEEHKDRFLGRLLRDKFCESEDNGSLSGSDDEKRNALMLKDLVESMRKLEKKTRKCYPENVEKKFSSDKFVRMMVRDGCFVVELLRLYYKLHKGKEKSKESFSAHKEHQADDPIVNTRWILRTLQRDLLKLENQLPYFVLAELFKLTGKGQDKMSLEELIVIFFDPLSPRKDATSRLNRALRFDGTELPYNHMLDVFRSTFLKTIREKVQKNGWAPVSTVQNCDRHPMALHRFFNSCFTDSQGDHVKSLHLEKQLIYFASELQEVGIALKRQDCDDLLNIKFGEGTLHMSPLFIDNNSVPLFLNFVAYEQCHEKAKPYFTNYFMFLDSLINSSNDVQILHEEKILNHVLGSHFNVAKLLNGLCREIIYDNDQCYLSEEMKLANEHYVRYQRNKCLRWWRYLKGNYFSSPWTFLSLLAAITLLILTILQTIYTIYPYYRQSS